AAGGGALEPAPPSAELARREPAPDGGAGSEERRAIAERRDVEDGAGRGLIQPPRDDDETRGPGGAAAGAGSEPDPHLFGPPSGRAGGGSERFALSLATRV